MDERANTAEAQESLTLSRTGQSGANSLALNTQTKDVRSGFWAALVIGYGSLIALIALSGFGALDRAKTLYGSISQAYENNLAVETGLWEIRAQLQTSGRLVRDYLLDPSAEHFGSNSSKLSSLRAQTESEVALLEKLLPRESASSVSRMRHELELYWSSLDPVFDWNPEQKAALGFTFLQTELIPRRNSILDIAVQIEALNQRRHEKEQQELDRRQAELPVFVRRSVILTILLGIAIAALSLYWIKHLEAISERRKLEVERASNELRRLSQQLVHAQEEERKHLSHELHDEVGQTLTALRIELGNLDETCNFSDEHSRERILATKALAEQALRTVRDLAMGLRPAMLDDLGLVPALQWQGRDHSRRTGIPVSLEVEGALDELPEEYLTCVYRIVQEALTNIAKHASARTILVGVAALGNALSVSVQDDGVGFDAQTPTRGGLGLLGMAERVKKLGGTFEVVSHPGHGTAIMAQLPLQDTQIQSEEHTSVISR